MGVRSDWAFDPSARTWSQLPADPLIPSFDRTMVWTDAELVLLAIEDVPQPGSEGPAVYRAAALDPAAGSWRRLPHSEISGYDPSWFWVGGLLVNPTLGTSDGGEVNSWDRPYPHGGILDPVQETWAPLPDPPSPVPYFRPLPDAPSPGPYFPPLAAGETEYVSSFSGWALHVRSGERFRLDAPPGTAHEGQAITWAGDRLFVWGGVRWDDMEAMLDAKGTILAEGWLWTAT